jgi:hypothetical protein
MTWGLIPWFSRDGKTTYSTINARAESAQMRRIASRSRGGAASCRRRGTLNGQVQRTIDSRTTSHGRMASRSGSRGFGTDGAARISRRPRNRSPFLKTFNRDLAIGKVRLDGGGFCAKRFDLSNDDLGRLQVSGVVNGDERCALLCKSKRYGTADALRGRRSSRSFRNDDSHEPARALIGCTPRPRRANWRGFTVGLFHLPRKPLQILLPIAGARVAVSLGGGSRC